MNQQPLDETQLQALLRLKRYEQPPQNYFDDLLTQVHRRQREELLRRPAWRIATDRVRAFFAPMRVDWAHAASMASLLVIGIAVIRVALPDRTTAGSQIAGSTSPAPQPIPHEPVLTLQPRSEVSLVADSKRRATKNFEPADSDGPTRFIIDTQPVSYEATQVRF